MLTLIKSALDNRDSFFLANIDHAFLRQVLEALGRGYREAAIATDTASLALHSLHINNGLHDGCRELQYRVIACMAFHISHLFIAQITVQPRLICIELLLAYATSHSWYHGHALLLEAFAPACHFRLEAVNYDRAHLFFCQLTEELLHVC